jgi:hypothetical protein
VLARVERLAELQVEQLIALGRVGLVRVEEDGRELAAGEPDPGPPEPQPVFALDDLYVFGSEVQPDLAAVLDDAADMPLEGLTPLVPERPELLRRVNAQLDTVAVAEEPAVSYGTDGHGRWDRSALRGLPSLRENGGYSGLREDG